VIKTTQKMPPITLGSALAFMEVCREKYLVAAASNCDLLVWDISKESLLIKTSLKSLITNRSLEFQVSIGLSLLFFFSSSFSPLLDLLFSISSRMFCLLTTITQKAFIKLNPDGTPIVGTTDQNAYAFHRPMQSWTRIADRSFVDSYFRSNLTVKTRGILSEVQVFAQLGSTSSSHNNSLNQNNHNAITVSHLGVCILTPLS